MACVLVIGGGLAGCAAALELAGNGLEAVIVEKGDNIGGKVREYGCKSTERCNRCGLCLAAGLWEQVDKSGRIRILTGSTVSDIRGKKDDFTAYVKSGGKLITLTGLKAVIAATGFDDFSGNSGGVVEMEAGCNVLSGLSLEKLLSRRDTEGVFHDGAPKSIAFIQCFGSRDVKEKAPYCSRVCCGYSTRAARVLRKYYPEMRIVFFYMDLQQVENGSYYRVLTNENIEMVRCRPVKVRGGKEAAILYEKTGEGIVEETFDMVVLTGGIHPSKDNERLAEILMLGTDGNGFLRSVKDGRTTGVFIAGCAGGPKGIEETYAQAILAAREICGAGPAHGGTIHPARRGHGG